MRNIRQLLVAFLMSVVVACGGGGTLGTSGTPETPKYAATLKLMTAAGVESNQLSAQSPLTLEVVLTSSNGGAINGKLISFELSNSTVAQFSNGTASAVTDSNGVARISLLVGQSSGAAEITATLPDSSKKTIAFQSLGVVPVSYSGSIKLLNASGAEAGTLSQAVPLTVEFTLSSSSGGNLGGQIIRFALSDNAVGQFDNATASAVTDAKGVAKIGLTVGTKSGAAELSATLPDNSLTKKAFLSAGDSPSTDQLALTLSMVSADGTEVSAVSKDKPVRVRAQLKSKLGLNVANQQINFSINVADLARFSNGSGTAQTNSSGVAEIILTAGTKSGTGTITAELNTDKAVKASKTFDSAGDGGPVSYSSTIKLFNSNGVETGTLSYAAPLTVELTLTSGNGGVVSGQVIKFALSDKDVAQFDNATASAVTDAKGVAKIGLTVGIKSGAAELIATLPDNTVTRKAFVSAGDNPAADQLSIALSMLAADGTEVSAVSKDKPVRVRAQLKSKLGLNVANQQINFAINLAELARFSNSVATAQTNSSGVAEIGLTAGTASGTGTLTAELNSNKNVNASKSFDSAGDGGAVTTDPVSTVLLQSDKLQLGSGTLDKVELTAIVRDRQQNLLKDVTVKFGIETGYEGEIEVQSATTDSTGTARAVLTTKTNPALRDILVSATAGAGTAKSYLTLKVVGTDIEIASAPAVVLGSSIDMTFTVLDSASKPIRDTVLSLSSELKNSFSNTSPRTDAATGRATVRYTAVNAGNDTVTVSALGVIKTVRIEVNADAFAYVKPANEAEIPEIALNTPASSTVKWTRSGSPIAAQDVGFTTTRGVIASDVARLADNKVVSTIQTNAAGEAQIFMRSAFAGLASISANTRGAGASLQTQKVVEFIATIPDPARPLEVQAIPAQVAPGDKAIIQAIVRDANNNPVKNKEIAFSLVDSFGGQLSPATARTNSQGIATTEFTADTTTPGSGNPQDPKGLKIKATISDNDAISGTTAISVGNRTLFFRFATGNGIEESADKVLYKKKYAVLVTDSTGNPVPNQVLTVSVLPKRYNKGHWFKRPVNQAFKFWEPVPSTTTDDLTCLSEDKNRNGILDAGEDENGDKQLTPGNVATVEKNITAGADGIAYFTLTYAKTMAPFVDVEVVVSGFAAGTENVSSRTVALSYSSEDTTDESDRPWESPFGVDALQNDEGFTTRDICAINGQTFPKQN